MQQALSLAREAASMGEVPIGAVLVRQGEVIGRGSNRTITDNDPTAHAEIVALRDAAKSVANHRLIDTDLFVTIEPCTMCAGALVHARVARLFFGAREPRAGSVVSTCQVLANPGLNHQVEVFEGISSDACAELMTTFFQHKRRVPS